MSTSDTRASSVSLVYRQAVGPLTGRVLSYNANFSSTGGKLSAQFGAHVLQLQESQAVDALYGAAATGAAVWNIPLMDRFDNGVPRVGLVTYVGAAPTAAVSGRRNFLNVPLGIGLGAALSPASWISITPWFEAAPGLDLDTTIEDPDLSPYAPSESDIQDIINNRQPVPLTEAEVRNLLSDSVKVDLAFEMAMRAGLDVTLRMTESWSANVNTYLTSLGSYFGGETFVYAGAGLVYHWDDIVPPVLPAARRLQNESCEDIEARFRMCPAGQRVEQTPASSFQSPVQGPPVGEPVDGGTKPWDTRETSDVVPESGSGESSTLEPSDPPSTVEPGFAPESSGNLPPTQTFPESPPSPSGDATLPNVNAPY
jgi:hypothetical protein